MIGIIGGTGLYQMAELAAPRTQEMTTPFGPPSAPPLLGSLRGHAVAFLARHGLRHACPARSTSAPTSGR